MTLVRLIAALVLLTSLPATAQVVVEGSNAVGAADPVRDAQVQAATTKTFELLETMMREGVSLEYESDIAVALPANADGLTVFGQTAWATSDSGIGRHVWASVTKQVVATMVMQQVEDNRLALDAFVTSYVILPPAGDLRPPTIRELLQHRSGLRNPEADRTASAFYTADLSRAERGEWCLEDRLGAPVAEWQYNNCDYIVLGAVLENVSRQSFEQLFAERIAEPSGIRNTRLWGPDDSMDWAGAGEPAAPDGLAGYGTSAALVGPTSDLLAFSRALLDGRLLGEAARTEMWRGDPDLGYMALGQWSYPARLDGCADEVNIVERRGGIGRFQALNLIFPDLGKALVLTNGLEGTDFGTIWAGEGIAFTLASILACEVHE